MSETARTNRNKGWTPKGPIGGNLIKAAASLRELADKLTGEDRETANHIASIVAEEAQHVDGLELATVN